MDPFVTPAKIFAPKGQVRAWVALQVVFVDWNIGALVVAADTRSSST